MLSKIVFLVSMAALSTGDELYGPVGDIAKSEVAACEGWVRFSADGDNQANSITYAALARRDNIHTIHVVAYKVRTEQLADRLWADLRPSVRTTEPETGFSGLPIGSKTRRIQGRGAIALHAIDGLFATNVYINFPSPPATLESDKELVEGLTRRTLARCRGLQAQAASNMNVGGASVSSITGPRGERLVDLVRYCQALNLQLSTNGPLGTASFSSGGEMVIVPLSAKKIKDGGRWIESLDISLIKDGKWYVSYAALQEARGQ